MEIFETRRMLVFGFCHYIQKSNIKSFTNKSRLHDVTLVVLYLNINLNLFYANLHNRGHVSS